MDETDNLFVLELTTLSFRRSVDTWAIPAKLVIVQTSPAHRTYPLGSIQKYANLYET